MVFERFTDRARRVIVLAQEEARMLNHSYIGTEHILLGLIHEGEGVAAETLESLGISLEAVRGQVEEIIGKGQTTPPKHIPFTPRTKKVIELTLREALQLNHKYIGTEHVLLGLINEGEGVASQVLVRLGADLIRTRQQVLQLLSSYAAPTAEPEPVLIPQWDTASDVELHAAILGLPLLGTAGVVVPLALLADLVRLTGAGDPRDRRLQGLTAHTGVVRLQALAWPPPSRVALAGMLCADLRFDPAYTLPDAPPEDLRDVLHEAVVGLAATPPPELRELKQRITTAQQEKYDYIDAQDFESAVRRRDAEKQLLAQKAKLEQTWRQTRIPFSLPAEPAISAVDDHAVAMLRIAADAVTEQTVMMLRILGPAAAAAAPELPLKLRDRIAALPRITVAHRTLFAECVIATEGRNRVVSPTRSVTAGVSGISRHGRLANLLPSQLALPADLFTLRMANQELLYRLRETQQEAPPSAVTIVLDTSPATFGPPELILRLVAHLLTSTLWAADRTPWLVTLDRPGLGRQVTTPEDLVAIWTRRTLDPPAMEKALATAGQLGNPVVVLTQHHLAHDLPLVAHADLRVVTTHIADDAPTGTAGGPFHIHLDPDAKPSTLIDAVDKLLRQEDPRDGL